MNGISLPKKLSGLILVVMAISVAVAPHAKVDATGTIMHLGWYNILNALGYLGLLLIHLVTGILIWMGLIWLILPAIDIANWSALVEHFTQTENDSYSMLVGKLFFACVMLSGIAPYTTLWQYLVNVAFRGGFVLLIDLAVVSIYSRFVGLYSWEQFRSWMKENKNDAHVSFLGDVLVGVAMAALLTVLL